MAELLDDIDNKERPKTNYKKWSFRLLIYALIAGLAFAYKFYSFEPQLHNPLAHARDLSILSLIIQACLAIGAILTFLSFRNNEEKDYKFYISTWGYPLIIIVVIAFNLIPFFLS